MNPSANKTMPVDIVEDEFRAEVINASQPVLVEFWAPWSRPCRILDATLAELAEERPGAVKVVKVNADSHPDLSLWYDIQSVPTLLFFWEGEPRCRIIGTATKEAILAKVRLYCGAASQTLAK